MPALRGGGSNGKASHGYNHITPEAILEAVGGAGNIIHLTHCATRLRFELNDASIVDKATVEAIPGKFVDRKSVV